MPDLTGSDIGKNYRRAIANFSRFGTRKLAFYTIWIYNLPDDEVGLFDGEVEYKGDGRGWPNEWIEQPGNILEAVFRGIQLVAEPYHYGDWETNNGDGPGLSDLSITVAVANNTFQDGYDQLHSPYPANQNSYSLESAIADAIANFPNDGVYVQQAELIGDYIAEYWGDDALTPPGASRNRASEERNAIIQAKKQARAAAGKVAYKRKG